MEIPAQQRIMITGGLGFIGSHFVTKMLKRGVHVINVDKVTYAVRKDLNFERFPNYQFIRTDIADMTSLPSGISHIVNFAAESHVDNSIASSSAFMKSNILGVYNILELIRGLPEKERPVLVHISTDEVYGDIRDGSFLETDRLCPSSPYSASKAAADQLIHSWSRTFGLRTRTCRPSNNYGYGQHSEKFIPRIMKLAHKGQKMTVHGDGSYSREWTFVGDTGDAVALVMDRGQDGEIYNISSGESLTNMEVVKLVHSIMNQPENFYEFVSNRPGQDIRYSVNADKIRAIGWKPTMTVAQYIPICEELNEVRRNHQPLGKKKMLAKMFGLDKIFKNNKSTRV